MPPWADVPTISIDLAGPIERRYDAVPKEVVARGQRLLKTLSAQAPPFAAPLADLVRVRTRGLFHAEACALADSIGSSWRAVMLANLAYDAALAFYGCSTIALATRDGPVLARNMDWWPEAILARTSCLVHACRDGELVFANAGWPGAIGVVSGLSARGFAIVLNAVQSPHRLDLRGYPVLLHVRRVLEQARAFDEAVDWLARERLTVGALFTVVGRHNHERVVIERVQRRHTMRRPNGNQPILATNHYRRLHEIIDVGAYDPAEWLCTRYDALAAAFADHDGHEPVDDARLLYALTDPAVRQGITAQHVIARPRDRCIRLWVPRKLLGDSSADPRSRPCDR